MSTKHLIVIAGPTAVGKTDLTIKLANAFNTDILSCDSRQFYKEMNIGTAKPTNDELKRAKHHFINNLSIHDNYSVGKYEEDALTLLDQLFKTTDIVFMTGGTGLYIDAVCFGLNEFPNVSEDYKDKWIQIHKDKGLDFLQIELQRQDPEYYSEVDIHNPSRLIRALAFIEAIGQKFSKFRNQPKKNRTFNTHFIKLARERSLLYDRINLRVDMMIDYGLIEEAKTLFPYREINALQTVGYRELFDHFEGNTTLDRAIELIKQNSRRYAKRQMTWLRKEHYKSFHPNQLEDIITHIQSII